MQYFQDGNKLYIIGGYGYDSSSDGFVTFSVMTVIDVAEMIQAVITGTNILNHIRQLTDAVVQVCGGEMRKLDDYFYLVGGHKFTGYYNQFSNDQVYTDQIRKFKISDNGVDVSIANYSAFTDTSEYHRRDLNLVPAMKPDGITPYMILYGGVFRHGADLPFLNPVYINNNGISVDISFAQKMSQYTCSHLSAFNENTGNMHTTFFGGMSVYYYNEITHMQEYDSLVPFIDDITTLTRHSDGTSEEVISAVTLPALLGTNAKFIPEPNVPHYDNSVIKLSELSGRTFAGYIYGGIRALFPNNTPSYPSDYILKVYINPNQINIKSIGNTVPSQFTLSQNYPNPFNPVTKIKFNVPVNSDVKLTVYDAMGREVTTLVDQKLNSGVYEASWDGSNFSSGIYFYKLTSGYSTSGNGNNFAETKKMILLK